MGDERHSLVIRPDGSVVLPDLTSELAAVAVALADSPRAASPCLLGPPRLTRAKAVKLALPGPPADLTTSQLWRWHARGAGRFRRCEPGAGGWSWLDVKCELAHRLLGPVCRLCARECRADRRRGAMGVCGQTADLRALATLRLWGEEPELGAPGLAVSTVGCGLRCRFCYKPDNLAAAAGEVVEPGALAAAIDAADDVRHVHWLGGNPDELLPAILAVHAAVQVDRPVVWNTHSYLTAPQALLLEGVVDAAVADLKFGPGDCCELAGIQGYWPVATATLRRLARLDLALIVRHVALPGHLDCCAQPAAAWARANLPGARVRVLAQYEPWGGALGDPRLGRRLNHEELTAVARLGDDPPLGRVSSCHV